MREREGGSHSLWSDNTRHASKIKSHLVPSVSRSSPIISFTHNTTVRWDKQQNRRSCCRVMYTWKNRQPSRVIGDPNRVTRQARIFTSVTESNVGQEEDLNLFIRGVYTRRLREGEERGRKERNQQEAEGREGGM